MIVTTGARSTSSSSASSNTGSATVSSSEWTISTSLPSSDGENDDRVVGQRLRLRLHLAELHELLDDLRHAHVEVLGDVLDGRAGVDLDRVGDGERRTRGTRFGLFVVDAAATTSAALAARGWLDAPPGTAARPAGGARREAWAVDHDAPASAGVAGRALALKRVARRPLLMVLAVLGGRAGRSGARGCTVDGDRSRVSDGPPQRPQVSQRPRLSQRREPFERREP